MNTLFSVSNLECCHHVGGTKSKSSDKRSKYKPLTLLKLRFIHNNFDKEKGGSKMLLNKHMQPPPTPLIPYLLLDLSPIMAGLVLRTILLNCVTKVLMSASVRRTISSVIQKDVRVNITIIVVRIYFENKVVVLKIQFMLITSSLTKRARMLIKAKNKMEWWPVVMDWEECNKCECYLSNLKADIFIELQDIRADF